MSTMIWCLFILAMWLSPVVSVDKWSPRARRSFQSVQFPPPERKGRQCHDFCAMIPNFCRNNGRCVIDEVTCIGSCVCAPGWTGKWCKEKVSEHTKQTTPDELYRDYNSSNTVTEVNKVHVTGNVTLDPDLQSKFQDLGEGWENDVNSHVFDRLQKVRKSSDFQRQAHGNVEQSAVNDTVRDPETDSVLRRACLASCSNENCINVDGEYKCVQEIPLSTGEEAGTRTAPRACGPGFECEHGVCDLQALESNSYRCICADNYVGQFCNTKCPLECGKHGRCEIHVGDGTFKCYCHWNYTGVNCSELIPEEPGPVQPDEVIFHWYVVGVSITMVTAVLASLAGAAYVMWKRRLVFVLKIVHYFQHYEDDDGKEYDAFISYKSCPRDEEFVLQQLYPKLEADFQFKLCMHFRDFLPGEAIANNIVKAIESSRRTIMVLSPEYVKSEWCRMEYQKAQHEMLKLKHKIIPIVLEDISDVKNVDKNLKSILSSVTYLEWPGMDSESKKMEKFWKKLELSLPKKSSQKASNPFTASDGSINASLSSLSRSDKTRSKVPSPESASHCVDMPESLECVSPPLAKHLESRQVTDSPTPSSDTASTTSPKFQRKKKDFKHFMGKLVRTKLFNRQDSNSSQAALVDAETLASRSSCGSVSESILTESSEPPSPCCSTPATPQESRRNSVAIDGNAFFPICPSVVLTKERFQQSLRKCKEMEEVCEKDHCGERECQSCRVSFDIGPEDVQISHDGDSHAYVNHSFLSEGRTIVNSQECEYCRYITCRSDNNRVKISAVTGADQIQVQKLPSRDIDACAYCNHGLQNNTYRGSIKHHKNAANELMRQKRVGSLPRNYKNSQIVKANVNTLSGDSKEKDDSTQRNKFHIDICESV